MIYSQETCQEAEVGMVYQFSDDTDFSDYTVGILERRLPNSHYAFQAVDIDGVILNWAYCRAVPKELLGA